MPEDGAMTEQKRDVNAAPRASGLEEDRLAEGRDEARGVVDVGCVDRALGALIGEGCSSGVRCRQRRWLLAPPVRAWRWAGKARGRRTFRDAGLGRAEAREVERPGGKGRKG